MNIKNLLISASGMMHNAMYCIYMAEHYSSFTLGRNNEAETMGRFTVACAAFGIGGLAGGLYQYCTSGTTDKNKYTPIEPQNTTWWSSTKTFMTNFHDAFCLSAGPASFSYTVFPLINLTNTQGFQALTTISTVGTAIGAGYGFFKACRKTAPTEAAPTAGSSIQV